MTKKRSILTAKEKKNIPSREPAELRGRPVQGVMPDKVNRYLDIIDSWVFSDDLKGSFNGKIYQPEASRNNKAKQAVSRIRKALAEDKRADKLEKWVGEYLSLYGWEQLQATYRQGRFHKGYVKEVGEGVRSEIKTLKLTEPTINRLRAFAKDHKLTLEEAVLSLLDGQGK